MPLLCLNRKVLQGEPSTSLSFLLLPLSSPFLSFLSIRTHDAQTQSRQHVLIHTGEKLYRGTEMVDGRPRPIGLKSAGVKQRVHGVAEDASDGNVYVTLRSDGGEVASDEYGCRERDRGRRDLPNSSRRGGRWWW